MPAPPSIAQDVRTHDYPRYLLAQFIPAHAREAALTLFAFELEIRRIPQSVREAMLGHIRYSWWREQVEALFEGKAPKGHPVLEAMLPAAQSGFLGRENLITFIDAEEARFAEAPATLEAWEAYAKETSGALMAAVARLGGQEKYAQAAEQAGARYALAEAYAEAGAKRDVTLCHILSRVQAGLESGQGQKESHFNRLPKWVRALSVTSRHIARTAGHPGRGKGEVRLLIKMLLA